MDSAIQRIIRSRARRMKDFGSSGSRHGARLALAMLPFGSGEDLAKPRHDAFEDAGAGLPLLDRRIGLGDLAVELVARAAGGDKEDIH